MRHRKHTFKVGRTSSHRKALLSNLVSSLLLEGRVKTTVTKAKEARRLAEKMVTLGKRGTLHHRRRAISLLHRPDVVGVLFRDIAPRYHERPGGYTRIIRIGQRTGDAAEMCFLELVTEAYQPKTKAETPLPAAEDTPVEAPVDTAEESSAEEASAGTEDDAPEADAAADTDGAEAEKA